MGAAGVAVLRRLHAQVLPFLMRRTKDQVAQELPRKVGIRWIVSYIYVGSSVLYLEEPACLRFSSLVVWV